VNLGRSVREGTIQSGAFRLSYSIEGEGPTVLVVGSAVYYPRVFSAGLRQKLKFVFVDHRGFARASGNPPVSEYGLDIILDDIEHVRRQLDLGKVIILGHSGHGYMALEYAKQYPDAVSHVVMIGTGPSHRPEHQALTERYWQEAVCPERKKRLDEDMANIGAEIQAAPEKRFVTFCIRMGARSWYDYTYDAAPLWEGVEVNMPAFDHLWGDAFARIDIRKDLRSLKAPVFLALGRFDHLVAPYEAWTSYRDDFNDLTLRVFDRSGHTPQLEESAAFDVELLAWLASKQ
jgi:proline iminopeptidase